MPHGYTRRGSAKSGGRIWIATVPQDPLETETDYFTGAALDAKWTAWDVAGDHSAAVSDGLVITCDSSADDNYGGIVQPLPADDQFCITADLRAVGRYSQGPALAWSLIIGEDLVANPATASFFNMQLVTDTNGIHVECTIFNNYSSFGGTPHAKDESPVPHACFLRWYVDRTAGVAGEVTPMFSANGRDWLHFSAVAVNGTAINSLDTFGLAILDMLNDGGATLWRSNMVRIDITSDKRFAVGTLVEV